VGGYYDPGTGQFLSVDPLVDETGQTYAYTGDDPVNGADPSGESAGISGAPSAAYCFEKSDIGNQPASCRGSFPPSADLARIGVGLGLVAVALTGVGLVAELSTAASVAVGGAAVVAGTAATGLDYGPCFDQHDSFACLGFGLGVLSTALGGSGAVLDSDLLNLLAVKFGLTGVTLDLVSALIGESGLSSGTSKVSSCNPGGNKLR